MATVFKARDPALDRYVAVKVLPSYDAQDSTFISRFTQEARSIARLRHPNILQVYDSGDDKGFAFIVTEFIPGGTLHQKLVGPLGLDETLAILRPLAEALDYAHSQGIVHRDIKPANALIDTDSKPVLADFGLSKLMQYSSSLTAPQAALGTPEYMSPEQAMGQDTDRRSDLYSLGIVAYQMLVGEPPFHADTPAATLMAHVHQPLPLPEGVDLNINAAVKAFLIKATAKNPSDRYSSATEMVRVLEQASDPSPGTEPEASPTVVVPAASSEAVLSTDIPVIGASARSYLTRQRLVLGLGLSLVVVVSLGLFGVFFLRGGSEPGDQVETVVSGPTVLPSSSPVTPATASAVGGPVSSPTTVPSEPTPSTSLAEALASLEETIAQIQSRIVLLRRLTPHEEPTTNLRTREQLAVLANGFFKREFIRDQVFMLGELYKTLGLLDEGDDLEQITADILMQQVSALYDDESQELYVLSDAAAIGPVEELSYASVFMAALQQQTFDVSLLRQQARENDNFDQYRAVTAFITGEVAQAQQGYVSSFFSEEDVEKLREPLPENKLTTAPDVVRKTVLFPNREGSNFIAEVFNAGGSGDAVNQIYENPPVSTEQIIHPGKYLSGEKPDIPDLPDLESVLGRGWGLTSENTMGELLLRTYLEEHLSESNAASAAEGWGGDRYALLLGPEAERLLALLINWDTPEDSADFFRAYQEFAGTKTGEEAAILPEGPYQTRWITPEVTLFIRQDEGSTLLIIADDETLIEKALSAF